MANVFWLTCPKCGKRFYAEITMLEIDTKFHCPFCDLYFDREERVKKEEK